MISVIPIKTKRLLKNPLAEIFKIAKKKLKNKDILVLTSKIVSLEYDGLINLKSVVSSQKAQKLAKKYGISSQFAQLIINESDQVLGGVKRAVLTLKSGILMANAGIDASNVPQNYVVKLPKNLEQIADDIRACLRRQVNLCSDLSSESADLAEKEDPRKSASSPRLSALGIVVSDSVCLPLRLGTHHYALAISGFSGIMDERGKKDLFHKPMKITTHNIADEIASTAGLIMGERNERIPAVIIRGLPVKFTNLSAKKLTKELIIDRNKDLFKEIIRLN